MNSTRTLDDHIDVPAASAGLKLVFNLITEIRVREIVCCQWKGHAKLSRWLTGEGDIDLLVSRADADRFDIAMNGLGFKRTLPGREPIISGVWHYYGLDAGTGRVVHLHVYFQLCLGNSLTMNYLMPVEKEVLETRRQTDYLPVPSPEWELVLRVLNHALRTPFIALKPGAQPAPSADRAAEQHTPKAESSVLQAILRDSIGWISPELFADCLQQECGRVSVVNRWSLLLRLKLAWSAHSRIAPWADGVRCLLLRSARRVRILRGHNADGKRLANGGAIIAIIGGDGSGKSTAVAALHRWLSPRFDVRRVHLGRPQPSLFTIAVAAARRIMEPAFIFAGRIPAPDISRQVLDPARETGPGLLRAVRMLRSVCIARDRLKTYKSIRKFAGAGGIVICDRFPLPHVRIMDGPNLGRARYAANSALMERVTNTFIRWEASCYRQIREPDLILVLRLDPEVAVRRKTDEEPDYVRKRCTDMWELDWSSSRAIVVDASQSPEEVLSELKTAIWDEV